MQDPPRLTNISTWDFIQAIEIAAACAIAYAVMTNGLVGMVARSDDVLGGMWAAVAAIFVFRDTEFASITAGVSRLIATTVSLALCLPYLLIFHVTPFGMVVVLVIGSLVMTLLGRRNDNITTAITTVVVMAVAELDPKNGWDQPLLRLLDTIVGVAVGVACQWLGAVLLSRLRARSTG